MSRDLVILIEHLESDLGKWILAEYRNAYRIAGDRLLITGVEVPGIPSTRRSFHEIADLNKTVILDPSADEVLTPRDLDVYKYIVIGGILGSHPPMGRTRKLLSDRFPMVAKRNIGEHQFSIDGSVYMVMEISKGREISEIPIAVGLRIRMLVTIYSEHEIYLPYAYPLVKGKPVISEELLKYLTGGAGYSFEFDRIIGPVEKSRRGPRSRRRKAI